MNIFSELAQDSHGWAASLRDAENSFGNAGSTRPGLMSSKVSVSEYCWTVNRLKVSLLSPAFNAEL